MLFNIRYNLIYDRSDELYPTYNRLVSAKNKKHAYMVFTNIVIATAANRGIKIKVIEIEDV